MWLPVTRDLSGSTVNFIFQIKNCIYSLSIWNGCRFKVLQLMLCCQTAYARKRRPSILHFQHVLFNRNITAVQNQKIVSLSFPLFYIHKAPKKLTMAQCLKNYSMNLCSTCSFRLLAPLFILNGAISYKKGIYVSFCFGVWCFSAFIFFIVFSA